MKILNNRGPIIDTCGTARRTLQHSLKLLFTLTLWNHSEKSLWAHFIAMKSHMHFVWQVIKLWLSVSNAWDISINNSNNLSELSRAFKETMYECILFCSVIFLFYISYTRTIANGEFRRFKIPINVQTQRNYKKIYSKCIPLYSCLCFEVDFKASESL